MFQNYVILDYNETDITNLMLANAFQNYVILDYNETLSKKEVGR